jgi:hypothetical protein
MPAAESPAGGDLNRSAGVAGGQPPSAVFPGVLAARDAAGGTARKGVAMLGIVAVVLFIIAFLLNATSTATSAVFSPISLLLLGLACLTLHLIGVGTSWSVGRRSR